MRLVTAGAGAHRDLLAPFEFLFCSEAIGGFRAKEGQSALSFGKAVPAFLSEHNRSQKTSKDVISRIQVGGGGS